MVKRTQNEIERDYKRVKEAAEIVNSFKELEVLTGLKRCEIITSLKKHPRVYNRIKKKFEEKQTSNKSVETNASIKKTDKAIVIDTSISGVPDIEKILEEEPYNIILTQVVIKELSQMQHFNDEEAKRARHILAMPADNEDKFIHELISEDYETADKCILEYCLKNKDGVVLYTADKEMFNFAKVYKVPVKFFKAVSKSDNSRKKALTFAGVEKIGKELILDLDRNNTLYKKVRVISNNQEYDEGIVKLNIGDEIFLAADKSEGYVAFAHYKMISLWEDNHCALVFSRRLYDLKKLDFNHRYKSFLRDFRRLRA